jgi:hypothetical protein
MAQGRSMPPHTHETCIHGTCKMQVRHVEAHKPIPQPKSHSYPVRGTLLLACIMRWYKHVKFKEKKAWKNDVL